MADNSSMTSDDADASDLNTLHEATKNETSMTQKTELNDTQIPQEVELNETNILHKTDATDAKTSDEIDSDQQKTKSPKYLKLLYEVKKTLELLADANSAHDISDKEFNFREIEKIFSYVNEHLENLMQSMTPKKCSVFLMALFNIIIRLCSIDRSDVILYGLSFRLVMYKILMKLDYMLFDKPPNFSEYAGDVLDSILMNLSHDNLAGMCFERLLQNQANQAFSSKVADDTSAEFSQNQDINYDVLVASYIKHASDFNYLIPIRAMSEFAKNYSSVFWSMLIFIDKYMDSANKNDSQTLLEVTESILSVLWNLSDKIATVPMLVEIECGKKVLQWITTDRFESSVNELGHAMFSIIHNLSRDKIGMRQLRNEKAFEVLMKRKQLVDDKGDKDLSDSYAMALVSVTTSDKQPEENKDLIIAVSRTWYDSCKQTKENADLRYDGMHLSEILELLNCAFSNAYVIKEILNSKSNDETNPVLFFAQYLLSIYGALLDRGADELEKRAAKYLLKILLQISTYPEYQKELMEFNEFYVIIDSLAKRPKQDDAKRILYNIQDKTITNQLKKEKVPMIYVSYDRADEIFCQALVGELRKKTTIPIWVVYEHVESWDDIWDYVAPAIQSSAVIISILSSAYEENPDKNHELSYATSTNAQREEKLNIIAVQAEPNFSFNRQWMEDLIGKKNTIPHENSYEHLASKLSERIRLSKRSTTKCCVRFRKRS